MNLEDGQIVKLDDGSHVRVRLEEVQPDVGTGTVIQVLSGVSKGCLYLITLVGIRDPDEEYVSKWVAISLENFNRYQDPCFSESAKGALPEEYRVLGKDERDAVLQPLQAAARAMVSGTGGES